MFCYSYPWNVGSAKAEASGSASGPGSGLGSAKTVNAMEHKIKQTKATLIVRRVEFHLCYFDYTI